MTPLRPALLATMLLATSAPAGAAEWRVVDLGRLNKAAHCMEAAERTFTAMLAEAQIEAIRASGWVVYADALQDPARRDALITCTFGDARGTRATLVIHASGQTRGLSRLALRISEIFAWHAQRITQDWKESLR